MIVFGLVGCGGGGDDGGGDDDPVSVDAADLPPPVDAADEAPDAPPGSVATMSGVVTRTAEPEEDGVGHLYVALFDDNPVSNQQQTPIAQALIEDADMSASDAAIAYELADVPVRGAPYYVVAFLDDDGTVDTTNPAEAGPDTGDLISLDGLSPPQITVSSPGDVELDIVLTLAFPF